MLIGINGSSGFLGNKLVDRLSKDNDIVRLDRSGYIPQDIDVCFDLAAYGNLWGQNKIDKIYKANVYRVAKEISNYKGRIIFISTSSVTLPQQTFYSLSKKATENMLLLRGNSVIVRPYSIYGPQEYEGHLIPKLIDSCLNGTKMSFVPDPIHDFVYIDDFIDALILLKDSDYSGVIEVGTGEGHTNEQVKEIVEKITSKKANLVYVDKLRNYDNRDWICQSNKIVSFGWQPQTTLFKGIGNYERS